MKIEIHEFQSLSLPDNLDYCAVSYPWAGVKNENDLRGYIKVAGAEEADPIGISMLYDLSWAAWSVSRSEYIWLDRLCLMQTNKEDKQWQIERMFDIYHKCKVCIVIPGGLQRLATLEEETQWVDRAWTLQEVTAPQVTKVSVLYNPNSPANSILQPFRSDGKFWSDTNLVHYDYRGGRALMYMCEAIWRFTPNQPNQPNHPYRFLGFKSSQYSAVAHFLEGVNIKQHEWIWKAAMMRTSSRPCDRIYSIMRLFGVKLNQDNWEKDDMAGPAIALVQASLAAAHNLNYPSFEWDKAVPPKDLSWFLCTYWMDPDSDYSILPKFPKATVDGPAVWVYADGSEMNVADALEYRLNYLRPRWYANISCGPDAMDSQGYLTFTSHRALPLTNLTDRHRSAIPPALDRCSMFAPDMFFCPFTRTYWGLWPPPTYGYEPPQWDYCVSQADGLAVWIGTSHGEFMDIHGRSSPFNEDTYIIVQKHSPGRFHRITHLNVPRPSRHPFDDMVSFYGVTVTVGGPVPYFNQKSL